jgi:hypothetical protein
MKLRELIEEVIPAIKLRIPALIFQRYFKSYAFNSTKRLSTIYHCLVCNIK